MLICQRAPYLICSMILYHVDDTRDADLPEMFLYKTWHAQRHSVTPWWCDSGMMVGWCDGDDTTVVMTRQLMFLVTDASEWVLLSNLWKKNTGWWCQSLWKIWKSVGMIIPNIWKNKSHVPNHQPCSRFRPYQIVHGVSSPIMATQSQKTTTIWLFNIAIENPL